MRRSEGRRDDGRACHRAGERGPVGFCRLPTSVVGRHTERAASDGPTTIRPSLAGVSVGTGKLRWMEAWEVWNGILERAGEASASTTRVNRSHGRLGRTRFEPGLQPSTRLVLAPPARPPHPWARRTAGAGPLRSSASKSASASARLGERCAPATVRSRGGAQRTAAASFGGAPGRPTPARRGRRGTRGAAQLWSGERRPAGPSGGAAPVRPRAVGTT